MRSRQQKKANNNQQQRQPEESDKLNATTIAAEISIHCVSFSLVINISPRFFNVNGDSLIWIDEAVFLAHI